MRYVITENDKSAILQSIVNYKYRLSITDDTERIIDVINDFLISNWNIDVESNIRRTLSIIVNKKTDIEKYINTNLRYNFVFQVGVFSFRLDDTIWYDCGTFVPTTANTSYDESNNSVSFDLGDWFAKLDGTRNGQIGGAPTISIPNKNDNDEFVTISGSLLNVMTSEGFKKCIIDDLGEFYGVQSNNPDKYLEYRENNPLWNKLPYDLEFNAGCNISDIVNEFIELYPNNQAYFDIYNNFCAGIIPSCNHNPIEIDNDFFQKILIADSSENVTYDIGGIKNVTEVFGKLYDVDRFATTSTSSENLYILTLDEYTEYSAYEYIAFTPVETNIDNMTLKINSLDALPIYREYTTEYIEAGTINKDEMCVVRIMRDKDNNHVAYYLGSYQPHAICVLTDNVNDTKYTKSYFESKYNCKNITLREEKGSPFTVQKLGEILDVKSGDEFENILSESVAAQNAVYQNQKSSSMNETINITTKLLPWIDVHCKVSYKKAQDGIVSEYIIKSVSHDIDNGTSSITLQKFYPLYYI